MDQAVLRFSGSFPGPSDISSGMDFIATCLCLALLCSTVPGNLVIHITAVASAET
jgi:hypothetical protein